MSKEDGFPHFDEVSSKEAGIFKANLQRAKKSQPDGAAVDVHKVADYKNMKMNMTAEGDAGYAVTQGGEITSVFKRRGSGYTDVSRRAAEHAVLMARGTHASAFDPKLPDMYGRGGLRALSHVQWNEDYKPPGWKFRRQGRPDVVFLGADRSVARESRSGAFKYEPMSTPETTDYDSGMAEAKEHGEKQVK